MFVAPCQKINCSCARDMAVGFYADPKLAKDAEHDKCLANVKSKLH